MLMQASGDIAMLIAAARAQRRNVLSEPEAKAFLRAQGISVPPGRAVAHPEEAPTVVRELGVPVVVKAVADQLTHKTDVSAVSMSRHYDRSRFGWRRCATGTSKRS